VGWEPEAVVRVGAVLRPSVGQHLHREQRRARRASPCVGQLQDLNQGRPVDHVAVAIQAFNAPPAASTPCPRRCSGMAACRWCCPGR
jgi:hypothetical protein